MIKFKKIYALIVKKFYNLSAHQIIEILHILRNAHVISKEKNQFVFYANNYINKD